MLLKKPKKIIYLISIIVGIIIPLFFNLRLYLQNGEISLFGIVSGISFSFLETFGISYFVSSAIDYFQQKFPCQKNLKKRLLFELVSLILISFFFTLFIFIIYVAVFNKFAPINYGTAFFDNVMVAIMMSYISYVLNVQ